MATALAAAIILAAAGVAGAALEEQRQATLWRQGLDADSQLGNSVALSDNGRRAVVGAPGYQGKGAVFWFAADGAGGWLANGGLIGPDVAADDAFGATVAMDGAGDTVLIGIPFDDVGGRVDQGRVAVFSRSGGSLEFSNYLAPAAALAGDGVGFGLALSDDGDTAIIGAPFDDVSGEVDQGSATVFTRTSDGSWSEGVTKTVVQGRAGDHFGMRAALSGPGDLAMIGEPGADPLLRSGAGAVVPFTRSGDVWTEQATLTRTGVVAGDRLGAAVALSADGRYLLAGAPGYSSDRGAAVVYALSGASWSQQALLVRATGSINDQMGSSVALSQDGSAAVVGVPYAAAEAGLLAQFIRSGSNWASAPPLTRANAGSLEHLGTSSAISPDGLIALSGAPGAKVSDTRTGTAVSFAASPPQELSPATLSGSGVVGTPLTAQPPQYLPAMRTDRMVWLSCAHPVTADGSLAGADCAVVQDGESAQFVPTQDLVGRNVVVFVESSTATAGASSTSASVAVVAPAPAVPAVVVAPVLSGPARTGRPVTVTAGTWAPVADSTTYSWLRCRTGGAATATVPVGCTVVAGAGTSSYTPAARDVGRHLRARVEARNVSGSATYITASTKTSALWARRTTIRKSKKYAWKRVFATGSSGTRSMKVTGGPCRIRAAKLKATGRGNCVVKAGVKAKAPYPRLRVSVTFTVRRS